MVSVYYGDLHGEMLTIIKSNDLGKFKKVLLDGYPVHDKNEHLLEVVCACGRLEMVKILVEEYGANFYFENFRPFLLACGLGKNLEMAKYFIFKGADPKSYDMIFPLRCAVICGNLDIIKFLIDYGLDFVPYGDWMIRLAKWAEQQEVVEYFITLQEIPKKMQQKKIWLGYIEAELMERTWHPSRLQWCLDMEEVKCI